MEDKGLNKGTEVEDFPETQHLKRGATLDSIPTHARHMQTEKRRDGKGRLRTLFLPAKVNPGNQEYREKSDSHSGIHICSNWLLLLDSESFPNKQYFLHVQAVQFILRHSLNIEPFNKK